MEETRVQYSRRKGPIWPSYFRIVGDVNMNGLRKIFRM